MAYHRKTIDEYQVQQYYPTGWETVTTEDSKAQAYAQLRCYRANQPEYPVRVHKVRVLISDRL